MYSTCVNMPSAVYAYLRNSHISIFWMHAVHLNSTNCAEQFTYLSISHILLAGKSFFFSFVFLLLEQKINKISAPAAMQS